MSEVLFEVMPGEAGDIGIMTLNRPQALNSLNHNMIQLLYQQLVKWQADDNIKAVVVKAVPGRAFCAGGDIRLTYERVKHHSENMTDFFQDEYQLNKFIFHYPKPYIALLNGITMGGGVGISVHGSHRVVTDNMLFAMPETGIGFFPDVGGTYFLPRLPGKIGLYLGLTGARIKADDCLFLKIATHKVADNVLDELLVSLANTAFKETAKDAVTSIINRFSSNVTHSELLSKQKEIDSAFAKETVEEIFSHLAQSSDSLSQQILADLQKKSPTSLKVTLKALTQGAQLPFDAVMQQEFRLTYHFLQGHDFMEGIRALIIDKDQQPQWQPKRLEDVNEQMVNHYFEAAPQELQSAV